MSTVGPIAAALPRAARSAATPAASAANTATGLESGPAAANGIPLAAAKTIAVTVAATSPYPMPTGRIPASGPEKISTAELTDNAKLKTDLTKPEMTSWNVANGDSERKARASA